MIMVSLRHLRPLPLPKQSSGSTSKRVGRRTVSITGSRSGERYASLEQLGRAYRRSTTSD